MKPLRPFFMEDHLENNRNTIKFNMGESGNVPLTIYEFLTKSGLKVDEITDQFLALSLRDSPNWGRLDLRQIVSDFHPGSSVENVLITTGTSEALFLLFRHLKPKKIALPIPAFQLLYEIPEALNCQIIPLPVRWDEHGQPFIDENEWGEILNTHTPDCVLINNPHNPSGLIFNDEVLNLIKNYCFKFGATLIGDEHYRFLSHASSKPGNLGPTVYENLCADKFGENKNPKIFVTGSYIKCTGTPGVRIGWCVGPNEDLRAMQNEKNYTTHTVNPVAEWMSVHALKNLNSKLWCDIFENLNSNKNTLAHFLKSSDTITGCVPQGGLVTCVGYKNLFTHKNDFEVMNQNLLSKNVFMLPLSSMEFGNYAFQTQKNYQGKILSQINLGFGFRLGLGIKNCDFDQVLTKII